MRWEAGIASINSSHCRVIRDSETKKTVVTMENIDNKTIQKIIDAHNEVVNVTMEEMTELAERIFHMAKAYHELRRDENND